MFGEIRAARDHEATGIDEQAAALRLGFGEALALHRGEHQAADAETGLAGAREKDALLGEAAAGDAAGGVQPREAHGAGALHVVVEAAQSAAVAREQSEGAGVIEILELHDRAGKHRLRRGDELLEQRVPGLAGHASLPLAEVHRVAAQRLVVRAHVECDGQA